MSNYFKILRPGINSTFQDLGRFGLQHLGIVPSGCMDRSLFYLANQLVGNEVFEGVLEFAYQGPLLELESESAEIAIAGKVNFNVIDKNGKIKQGV
ncbi:MAG: allophanate hydrolase, partial [Pelagibacteraceae bacterium]|nr:allophanate hydrolase [Pelagibacteraceae bacterium]